MRARERLVVKSARSRPNEINTRGERRLSNPDDLQLRTNREVSPTTLGYYSYCNVALGDTLAFNRTGLLPPPTPVRRLADRMWPIRRTPGEANGR